jgi:general secretion pathway protein I
MTNAQIPRSAGFSLLEVLVAFAVLALSAGAVLQAFSNGLRGLALSEEYSRATLLAESNLASVAGEDAFKQVEQTGSFDERYRWRRTIHPYARQGQEENAGSVMRPYEVKVEVSWAEHGVERSVSLTTLRLVRTQ